ncbi:MAG: hypothetical protein U0Q03_11210 [Acidimicrobiales bacterium]
MDRFLRTVSVDMIRQAWQQAASVLVGHGVAPQDCMWGWAHPGYMTTSRDIAVDSALDGFGWLLPPDAWGQLGFAALRDDEFYAHLHTVDESFAECDPALTVVYSQLRCYRWVDAAGVAPSPADASVGRELAFATMLQDMTDWRPRLDAGVGPWADIARAIKRRDFVAFHLAISAALREYSPTGAELAIRGYSDFLLHWSAYDRDDHS